jgi:hypothetical protein
MMPAVVPADGGHTLAPLVYDTRLSHRLRPHGCQTTKLVSHSDRPEPVLATQRFRSELMI